MDTTLPLKKINDEVFVATDDIVRIDARAVEFIRAYALRNQRGRARICAHKLPTDTLHEMLIGIRADSYIRPHRHHNKVESFHLVEGAADVVILNDAGAIEDVIELSHERNFYYRLDAPKYHTLLLNTPVLVVHEITNGPFDPGQTDHAAFAPAEGDGAAAGYVDNLRLSVANWKKNRR